MMMMMATESLPFPSLLSLFLSGSVIIGKEACSFLALYYFHHSPSFFFSLFSFF